MAMMAQIAGSLVAILLLGWAAHGLGLGGDARIDGEARARELAEEAICGFDAVDIAVDRDGHGALLRDGEGRTLLLRRHGSHFAARILASRATAHADGAKLLIATGERRFGDVTLDLGADAARWARRLSAGGRGAHA